TISRYCYYDRPPPKPEIDFNQIYLGYIVTAHNNPPVKMAKST
ncbi:UNVERIFIED_ORG: hypothetical protein QE446_000001, partial [Rhizobium sp. SORGH_AS260]|nr:hypothetical protein [Rhizobium sp. SORGH_AS_0260]MDR6079100.1 hypothetical protein [Agrobacterium sp. SORGH_AS_0440]